MKELLRCVELLHGMNKLGEPLWVRFRGETNKGDTVVGDKTGHAIGQEKEQNYQQKLWETGNSWGSCRCERKRSRSGCKDVRQRGNSEMQLVLEKAKLW